MIQIEAIMGENEISKISEGLRKIGIGGLTVFRQKGGEKPFLTEFTLNWGLRSIHLNSVIVTWFYLFCQIQKWTKLST